MSHEPAAEAFCHRGGHRLVDGLTYASRVGEGAHEVTDHGQLAVLVDELGRREGAGERAHARDGLVDDRR